MDKELKNILSEVTKAWIAGVIDCDGCITMSSPTGYADIRVGMMDKEMIDALERLSGVGNSWSSVKKFKAHRGRKKHVYHWEVCNNQAIQLLEAVRPYLIVKADQADIAISLKKTAHIRKKDNKPCHVCGERKPIYARRMCRLCYDRWYQKMRREGKKLKRYETRAVPKPILNLRREAYQKLRKCKEHPFVDGGDDA